MSDSRHSISLSIAAAALAIALAPATMAFAQDSPPAPASDLPGELDSLRPGGGPLLREGSLLVDVRGTMQFDDASKSWSLVIDADDPASPDYRLTILPCSVLQEMIELHAIAHDQPLAFEVSGRVLVYRGHSYVLPTYAPQITDERPFAADTATSAAPEAATDDDSVASIMRNLEDAVGPVVRARAPDSDRGVRDDDPDLVLEGTMLFARRGRLTRTASGAYMFVFDADASGLSDPPMIVLPCLLLERMEDYARSQGGVAPMVVNGRVLVFNGRNYLYPTVFQIPRERTHLTP